MFTLPLFFSLIVFASFSVYFFFGIYILYLNTKALINRVFFVICLALCLWAFSISIGNMAPDYETALFWRRVAALGWGTVYSLLLHYIMILTERDSLLQKKWIYLLLYLPAALNVFIYSFYHNMVMLQYNLVETPFGWVNASAGSMWDWYFNLYYGGFTIAGILLINQWGKTAPDPNKKKQSLLLVSAFTIALLLGSFTDIIANTYLAFTTPQLAPVVVLIPVSAIFYCINRYGLMMSKLDADQPAERDRILNEQARENIYQYLGAAFIFGSHMNGAIRYFVFNDPLLFELLFNGFFALIGITLFFAPRMVIRAEKQDYYLAVFLAAAVPLITLRFIDSVAVSVWAIPFIFVVLAVIFNKGSMILLLAVSILLTQVWVWVSMPELLVQVRGIHHIVRIGIFVIVIGLAYFINRVYIKRLRENEEQIRFQNVISQIAAGFVSVSESNRDEKINGMLQLSGEYCRADRSFIFLLSRDQKSVSNTHEWCNKGIESQIQILQDLPVHNFPWWLEKLKLFENVIINNVAKMPQAAAAEKALLQAQSVKSVLVVPFVLGDKLFGFMGFDSVTEEKKWKEAEISLLKVVAGITSSALAKQESEDVLRESENRLRAAFEGSHDAIAIMTKEGKLITCNNRALELYGLSSKEEFLGKMPVDFSPPLQPDGSDSYEVSRQYIKKAFKEEGYICFEWLHQRNDGSTFPAEVNLTTYLLGEEKVLQANIADITERKEYEEKLQYLSMHDALTGLYNRAFFDAEMERLNGSREYPVTIISADLDGLKLVNDMLGHIQGDALLKAGAAVLQKSLRNSDILARIGGDEFAVLLSRTENSTGKMIVGRIRSQVILYNNEHPGLPLSISVGMATAEKGAVPLAEIYKKADDLMYEDKLERKDMISAHIVDMLLETLAELDYIATGHCDRIAGWSMKMGEKLNLSQQQLIDLILLSLMHDVGKVTVPHAIIFKEEPLTAEEWDLMRQHAGKGYHIARSSSDLVEIANLILNHHEHWDGSGYPQGLKGKAIPLECRIFAIAEAFDVMTSGRSYRKAKSREEAELELKQNAGTQFDPELVEVFLECLSSNI